MDACNEQQLFQAIEKLQNTGLHQITKLANLAP